jgi:hypothetical protein
MDTMATVGGKAIPGVFAEGRTVFALPRLEYPTTRGGTSAWQVTVRLYDAAHRRQSMRPEYFAQGATLPEGFTAEIRVTSGVAGGKIRTVHPTIVRTGKNLGRSNQTNPLTQALKDAFSRHTRHERQLGRHDAAPAAEEEVGILPMLIRLEGSSPAATLTAADFADGLTAQRKLDGVRLMASLKGGELVLHSRSGHDYPGLTTLRRELARLLRHDPLVTLDGELYVHGRPLCWISGQARRADDEDLLEYHVFDCFLPEPSSGRQARLDRLFQMAAPDSRICRVENFPLPLTEKEGRAEIQRLLEAFLAEGYEGLVVRKDAAAYQPAHSNYHSTNALKIKPRFSDEFPLVGFTCGRRGKDEGALIWVAHVPDQPDVTFTAVPNMPYPARRELYAKLAAHPEFFTERLLGLPLTVEHAGISPRTGKPLQPKAAAVRSYEDPEGDPMRALFDLE